MRAGGASGFHGPLPASTALLVIDMQNFYVGEIESVVGIIPNINAIAVKLRALGGNTAPDRVAGLRTPRWQRELARELGTLADADGRIGLSFEVAYGHAFKGAPRVRSGEATKVSLEDMRAMVRSSHGRGKGLRPLR